MYCPFELSESIGGPLYGDQFTPQREIALHLYGILGKGINTEHSCTPGAKESFLGSLRRFVFRSTMGGCIFLPGKLKKPARDMAVMCFQEKRLASHLEDIRDGQNSQLTGPNS